MVILYKIWNFVQKAHESEADGECVRKMSLQVDELQMRMKKLENVEIECREELNEWCQKNETVTNEMEESVSTVKHVWEEEVLGKERSEGDDKREDCCVVS